MTRALPAPYRVPRPAGPIDLWLDANEGAPQPPELRRYPDAGPLERQLAARLGLDPAQVLVTAGADDALDRCFRALLDPGDAAVLPVPGFEMARRYAALAGVRAVEVGWPEGPFPVDAAIGAGARAVLVTSPNNPTGAVATARDLDRLADAGLLRIVDLAYAEFADEDLTAAALARPGAVVLRTLSKAWGLAGLRVGYALGAAEDVARLRAAGAPYPVAAPSLRLAAEVLAAGDAPVRAFTARIRRERDVLAATAAAAGLDPVPSQANFVWVRSPRAAWLRDALGGLGIAVRGFDGAVRIACPGDDDALARLCAAISAAAAPEALLLDLDGVLADVRGSYRAAIRQTAASFGVPVDDAAIAAAKDRGDANDDWALTWRLLRDRGVDAALDEVTRRFEAAYQGGLWRRERPLLGGFSALRARFGRIGVVTGRPRADAVRFLEGAGLRPDVLVCREDAPLKPDPAPVRLALARLGVQRAWMVGDTVDDVRAARAAGVVPLGVLAPGCVDGGALLRAGAARIVALDDLVTL
ncbi:MAG: aminotransferase class I/II-fold pyridoxal phosphate-dependent enzyme [Myxococcota bacterium]